ncbi:type IV pilus secretin PilQ [bacterium]|nr:type IV pilus secretin PilQ [bacterium]RQV93940.1 MAG: type IV pilus secretin PilQ [bacterium]
MKYRLPIFLLLSMILLPLAMQAQDRDRGYERRISMNVEQADIRTVLRSIAEFSGTNIVAGSEVTGPVTVLLNNVPWREALDNVLKINDFVSVEENGVIRVTTHKDIANAAKLEALETQIFNIEYARADQLRDVTSKLLTERGKVQSDVRANALIITDIPNVLADLGRIVKDLDKPTAQVLIEAKIVQVDHSRSRELGINWTAGNLSNPLANTRAGGNVDLGVKDPTGSFTLGKLENGANINAMLSALEDEKHAEVLSQPSVLINDNELATIISGKRIPINTLDLSGNLVTRFYDVAVKLNVTPHINPNNEVLMTLNPEVADLSGESTVAGGIIILTSEVRTTLLVKDGETVVIGGVIRSKQGSTDRRVPLLHAIPLFGRLFEYTVDTEDKSEILVFVTPHVIPAEMASK